jgi:hypothetical protein
MLAWIIHLAKILWEIKRINLNQGLDERLSHKFAKNSPLSLETMLKGPILKSLDEFLKTTLKIIRKHYYQKLLNTKSMLDENNIIDD